MTMLRVWPVLLLWNQVVGFSLIGLGAAFVFKPW